VATLTLSGVEQAAVLNHLRIQHGHLPPNSEDSLILHVVIGHVADDRVVNLQQIEAVVMLRYLRLQSKALLTDMTALEERRIRGGFNGQLENAHRALDADRTVIEDVIRRLWEIVV
jgi:hypothetical protein